MGKKSGFNNFFVAWRRGAWILIWLFFKIYFYLEDNHFTTLCWLLLYNSMSLSLGYKYPLPLNSLSLPCDSHQLSSSLGPHLLQHAIFSFSSIPHSSDVPEHKSTDNVYHRLDCESRQQRERQCGSQSVSPLTCKWLKQCYSLSLCYKSLDCHLQRRVSQALF